MKARNVVILLLLCFVSLNVSGQIIKREDTKKKESKEKVEKKTQSSKPRSSSNSGSRKRDNGSSNHSSGNGSQTKRASSGITTKPLDGPQTFTVNSSGKKVLFTKGNLYWDGSAFHFEKNQTDYPTSWNPNHVGHFYWTTTASASYAEKYNVSNESTSDVPFFAESKGGLTVDGTFGLFALSRNEWDYLISTRPNATSLCKYGVTVGNKKNCLIIAPDGFTGTLKSSYTLSEIEALGLVCLPAAGYRNGSDFYYAEGYGLYWSATPYSNNSYFAYYLYFYSDGVYTSYYNRYNGRSVRLVRLAQ